MKINFLIFLLFFFCFCIFFNDDKLTDLFCIHNEDKTYCLLLLKKENTSKEFQKLYFFSSVFTNPLFNSFRMQMYIEAYVSTY